jgi:hypothetical protein
MHRYKLVSIRARVKNSLQHLMLNRGVQSRRIITNVDQISANQPFWAKKRRKLVRTSVLNN